MKDNIVNKKSNVEKRSECVVEQMFSDHKQLRNEGKHFIKNERKSRFPLNLTDRHTDRNTDRHTDRHTYRRTDICFYRVASLLKKELTAEYSLTFYKKQAGKSGKINIVKEEIYNLNKKYKAPTYIYVY